MLQDRWQALRREPPGTSAPVRLSFKAARRTLWSYASVRECARALHGARAVGGPATAQRAAGFGVARICWPESYRLVFERLPKRRQAELLKAPGKTSGKPAGWSPAKRAERMAPPRKMQAAKPPRKKARKSRPRRGGGDEDCSSGSARVSAAGRRDWARRCRNGLRPRRKAASPTPHRNGRKAAQPLRSNRISSRCSVPATPGRFSRMSQERRERRPRRASPHSRRGGTGI